MKKRLLLTFLAFYALQQANGQFVFSEDFNYTVGSKLTDNGWTAYSEAGTNAVRSCFKI